MAKKIEPLSLETFCDYVKAMSKTSLSKFEIMTLCRFISEAYQKDELQMINEYIKVDQKLRMVSLCVERYLYSQRQNVTFKLYRTLRFLKNVDNPEICRLVNSEKGQEVSLLPPQVYHISAWSTECPDPEYLPRPGVDSVVLVSDIAYLWIVMAGCAVSLDGLPSDIVIIEQNKEMTAKIIDIAR